MAHTNVEERVKRVVVEQLLSGTDDVKSESRFVDDLNADSLDLVELAMAIEDEFEIEISDEVAEKWTTVQDAVNYISAL